MPPGEGTSGSASGSLELLEVTVRHRRKALGLRQADLADLAGVSERFVHAVENGKASLRLDKLLDLLRVLGLDLAVVRRGGGEEGGKDALSGPVGDT